MLSKIENSLNRLKAYCEAEEFKGWDPYDGLNSRVFRSLPVVRSNRFARLAWIQLFKRNPLNLRRLLRVDKDFNPKGLGLFLSGYCNLYRRSPSEEYLSRIRWLVDRIVEHISPGYSGACWGYNFDWQARAFFQPQGTPTVVASAFVGYALYDAAEILDDPGIREVADSVSGFIMMDLNRSYDEEGDFAFSYSPLDHSRVFNASLQGSRMLSKIYSHTGEKALLESAGRSVNYCLKHQQPDGSWAYSPLPFHQWIDSFHTGYNLECLAEFQKHTEEEHCTEAIERGFSYYMDHFFLEDGRCKYYHNSLYPIDIHAPAQFIITLNRLGKLSEFQDSARNVLHWVIDHMQDPSGYFYFQIRRRFSPKIPYIRWAQGWMFYALSDYLLNAEGG